MSQSAREFEWRVNGRRRKESVGIDKSNRKRGKFVVRVEVGITV